MGHGMKRHLRLKRFILTTVRRVQSFSNLENHRVVMGTQRPRAPPQGPLMGSVGLQIFPFRCFLLL